MNVENSVAIIVKHIEKISVDGIKEFIVVVVGN